MRIAKNMAAAVTNSVVVVLINILALPFYLRYLGMEAYGLIGFYAMLQAVLQVFDLGLAPTVSREIAHNAEIGEQRQSASLLRTLGVVYLGVAVAIATFVALASPWIGAHWLQAKQLPEMTVTSAVALMGLNLACRWPISLYNGALIGAHRLSLSSGVSTTINITAAVTTICVLAFGPRSILVFFLVQAVFGLLHATIIRAVARRVIGERDAPRDFGILRRVWSFSAWMSGVAVTSLFFTQLDKVLLSNFIDLESFGHYMLAVLLVSGIQVVIGPVFNVIYPKFTTLLARNDQLSLSRFYSDTSRIFAAVVFSLALGLALHTRAIVILWTGRQRHHVFPLRASNRERAPANSIRDQHGAVGSGGADHRLASHARGRGWWRAVVGNARRRVCHCGDGGNGSKGCRIRGRKMDLPRYRRASLARPGPGAGRGVAG
jgi:O-antigen/teichoic acid export membrane protein